MANVVHCIHCGKCDLSFYKIITFMRETESGKMNGGDATISNGVVCRDYNDLFVSKCMTVKVGNENMSRDSKFEKIRIYYRCMSCKGETLFVLQTDLNKTSFDVTSI